MILDDIVEKRRIQLAREKSRVPEAAMKKAALALNTPCRDFKAALSGDRLAVIAEVKKASPSKGVICADFQPEAIAMEYEKAGANALSVLTEEYYFQGSADILRAVRKTVSLPILRKDFIIDPYQIYEARVMGADAILLIAALLDTKTLAEYRILAQSLGLAVLAEVHNEPELESVLNAGCAIIGVNNRNLKTFEVSLETTRALAQRIPQDKIVVSESGIGNNAHMKQVREAGASAVLIGETLMRSGDISATMAELRAGV